MISTKKINERIKKRRKELGLTLKQVADALGVSEATVSRYESNDIQNMGIDKLEPLAVVLKCSPTYLLTGYKETELVIMEVKKCELQVYELDTSGDGSLVYKGVEVFMMPENFKFKEGAFALEIKENELQPRILDNDAVIVEKITFDDWKEIKGKVVIIEHQSLKKARIVEFQNGEPVLASITGFEKNISVNEKIEYIGVVTNLIRRKL